MSVKITLPSCPRQYVSINIIYIYFTTEYQTADVIVDALDFTQYDDGPYTQHNGKCGEMGERIHMSPNYLMTLFEEQKVLQYGKPGEYF